jgi:hypothetical protein
LFLLIGEVGPFWIRRINQHLQILNFIEIP